LPAEHPVRVTWWADDVRRRNDALTREDLFHAFPMKSELMRERLGTALLQMGFC
jgi:hypothetical protein